MLVGRVLRHQVDEDPKSSLFGGVGELDEVPESPVARVDLVIVGNIVPIVPTGGGLKRHQPDGGNPEAGEIIESAHQAGKVSYPLAIGVHIRGDREAIDHRIFVPKVADHVSEVPSFSASATITPSFALRLTLPTHRSSVRSICVESNARPLAMVESR